MKRKSKGTARACVPPTRLGGSGAGGGRGLGRTVSTPAQPWLGQDVPKHHVIAVNGYGKR